MKNNNIKPKNIILVANCTWYLYNFRKDLLEQLNNKGYKIILISPKDNYQNDNLIDTKVIEKDLEELVNLGLKRSSAASYLARKNRIPKNIIYNLRN